MADEFINLTPENVADEHICCIIRAEKSHPGIEAKRAWLAERLKEGHVFASWTPRSACLLNMRRLKRLGYR